MDVFLDYLLQNWALILVLLAFVIMLFVSVFLDRKTIRKISILIAAVFVLSIVVFFEFHLSNTNELPTLRAVLIAIRYSSTPIILALISVTYVKKLKWYILIPSFVFAIVNVVSIFTGIVFSIANDGSLVRGPLGYLPYIGVGIYSVFLIYILIRRSNKHASEIIPIIFLAFAFATGLVFPFIIGKDYSKIFSTTIAIALFVYYVFLILQMTEKDALTGLLNRQAYYAALRRSAKDITAIVSIDMNGLKTINDTQGHLAGDEALETLGVCFVRASRFNQSIYRIGGDEFMIICKKTSEEELEHLIANIRKSVSHTKYSCSIGYCYDSSENKKLEEMIKKSDEMMYQDKAQFYSAIDKNRRQN